MISEQQLQNWTRPLSETEGDKCSTTVTSIKKTLGDHFGSKVELFLQGSYKNKTNVRQDSDVDIVIRHKDAYFSHTSGLNEQDKNYHDNLPNATYTFADFKNEVEAVLRAKYGTDVERKKKCIKIQGNTYRVNADVVPCFEHKRLVSPYQISASGIGFMIDPPEAEAAYSFPDQHHTNGVDKNKRTNEIYKAVVRAIKNCRNHLIDEGHIDDKFMPSFFLECLVWNVPDPYFTGTTYKDIVSNVLLKIKSDMVAIETAHSYAEVSDLLWLFKGQKRTPEQAHLFVVMAHDLIHK